MLGVMATVTTGLLSPNSYGLNPEQAVKMAARSDDYDDNPYDGGARFANSSDSEADASAPCYRLTAPMVETAQPQSNKRNKRKNFEPRCTNITFSDAENENSLQHATNNNYNKNRRKTTARKIIHHPNASNFYPMDLTKPESESQSEPENSTSDEESAVRNQYHNESQDNENEDNSEEEKMANSFSIHNLSKSSTTPDFQQMAAAAAAASYHAQHALLNAAANANGPPGVDMREYAMNTMRELLGIYGLTSEVAESITRQLPIAAFASGQMLESLSLHHAAASQLNMPNQQRDQQAQSGSQTPPSQPPTPPSTPLSPKTPSASSISSVSHLSHLSSLTNSVNANIPSINTPTTPVSSNLPNIPNVTITTSPSNSRGPTTNTTSPLNLISSGKAKSATPASNRLFLPSATNGAAAVGGGVGQQSNAHSSLSPQSAALNSSGLLNLSNLTALSQLPGLEYSYNQLEQQLEAVRNRTILEENQKQLMNSRGIFPHFMNFSSMKSEDGSPPPSFDTASPLSAIMAQTFNAQRESQSLLTKSQPQIDYSKYVKKFSSSLECGSPYCKELNYREHFHCLDCNSRVFIKKEEMIRHFKWHKKRDESLQHGFMRYSPLDDCSDRYGNCCTHNKKQTHYHCIKEGCDKVYISTSDVQMHANYHRKDSAIIQEGFQRFRATEECGATYCAFFGQRTTHFHCRRSNCRYTFKNKSDMEKHKTYHIKDEQLSRDGFKKFMKNEACPYEACRFSKVCNHIHCIRPQCNYVLHSSGQLFSHKRKHERKDSELAYRKYKLAQSMMKSLADGVASFPSDFDAMQMNALAMGMGSNTSESLSERNSPVSLSYDEDNSSAMDLTANDSNFDESSLNWTNHSEEIWRKYCQLYSGNENCGCEFVNTEHYHCNGEMCEMTFNSKEAAREHARQHDQQEQVTDMYFSLSCEEPTTCPYPAKDKHYHCTWEHCREVILPQDKTFRRLEHYKMHEYSKKLSLTKDPLTMTHLATSIDGMFARKRGRPPKNRVIEVWNNDYQSSGQNLMDSPQAIFTSFKLPKPSSTSTPMANTKEEDFDERSQSPKSPKVSYGDSVMQGFDVFPENSKCPDAMCPFMGSMHYHCVQNRCVYVTDKEDSLAMHSKDFHDNGDIMEGCEFFEKGSDCRLPTCQHKSERHFHCTRGDCSYSFVKYSTLALHSLVHQPWDMQQHEQGLKQQYKNEPEDITDNTAIRDDRVGDKIQDSKISVVKASGTFYPLSSVAPPTAASVQNVHERKSPDVTKSTDSSDISGSNTLYGPEQSCSRPFCKLKRKFHYHCNACNQAFSEIDRLVVHVAKHSTGVLSGQTFHPEDNNNRNVTPSPPPAASKSPKIQVAPLQSLQNPTTPIKEENSANGAYLQQQFEAYQHFGNFPANLQFALMQQQQFLPQSYAAALSSQQLMFQHQAMMQNPLYSDNMSPLAAMAANLNKRALEGSQDMSPEAKKARIQSSMRILKDEPVPEGYLRFRFNEDCQYQHCGYREHQTHFHCQRMDCGYSFCDKTRFVQHTARHERLDTLMGGDFQQYRANVSCGRADCAYTAHLGSTQNKASHFHCLKCDFVCTDTNKVVAHRRQHQKLDSIQAAGFEKFTPSQQCRSTTCQHSGKQTHYHCLQCQYAVLGLAQMSAHKYRHMEG